MSTRCYTIPNTEAITRTGEHCLFQIKIIILIFAIGFGGLFYFIKSDTWGADPIAFPLTVD